MKWTKHSVSKLKNGPVKERLLKEINSNRRSPVTGSLEYWTRIIESKTTDYKKHPEKYVPGKGEQGVLSTRPYTQEILPHWKFRTEEEAIISAQTLQALFEHYLTKNDYVGADVTKKFLQMGFTRARRYANHPTGTKYKKNKHPSPRAQDSQTNEKARAADIFKHFWDEARTNEKLITLHQAFLNKRNQRAKNQ